MVCDTKLLPYTAGIFYGNIYMQQQTEAKHHEPAALTTEIHQEMSVGLRMISTLINEKLIAVKISHFMLIIKSIRQD